MSHVTENTHCLACGSANIHTALDLGEQPLANSYKDSAEQHEERYPLGVRLCHDCYHLQLSHTVDPEIIYKNYLYATGTNQTIKDYSKWFAEFCAETYPQAKSVLDIGCNDGTQLDYFTPLGIATYGIDPAKNLHDRIDSKHKVVCDFFGPSAVEKLNSVNYDLIIAQNVFAHNPEPFAFIKSCKELMSDDTVLMIQTSQADMVLHNEFDTIYHEHINFFNANSMNELAKRSGLNLIDVIKTPIHGNSYIFVLSKQAINKKRVENIIALEESYGLLNLDTYNRWAQIVRNNVDELIATVNHHREQGFILVGYGAAAKGNTLLNFSDIRLDAIIDDNPLKQEKFTPGTSAPIVSVEFLHNQSTDAKLLLMPLAWNFFKEIKARVQSNRTNSNDRFVRYFPKVEVQ